MKLTFLVLFLIGLLPVWVTPAGAQQAESQLRLIEEHHVIPGMLLEYEAAIKEAVAFRAEHEYPFPKRAYVTEGLVYAYVTDLEGWEDMTTNDQWYEPLSPPPDFVERRRSATDHETGSFQRTRPDLFTIPDNPRFQPGEAGFIHEIRLNLRPGTAAEAAEILTKFSALYKQHDIPDGRIVWSQVSGSEGPTLALFFPARDAADYYTHRQMNLEMMGGEYRTLQGELAALCRRIDRLNWTIRRDLSYQPTN